MEQCALKSVSNCLNTNTYSYLETPGGQSSNLYLNVVHIFNTSVNMTFVTAEDFLHWCRICAVLLLPTLDLYNKKSCQCSKHSSLL
jgi:hypothetical protein